MKASRLTSISWKLWRMRSVPPSEHNTRKQGSRICFAGIYAAEVSFPSSWRGPNLTCSKLGIEHGQDFVKVRFRAFWFAILFLRWCGDRTVYVRHVDNTFTCLPSIHMPVHPKELDQVVIYEFYIFVEGLHVSDRKALAQNENICQHVGETCIELDWSE